MPMPLYVLVPMLGASMLAPSIVALAVAVILRHAKSGGALAYGVGAFLWLILVAVSVGLNMYTYSIYPVWWDEEHTYMMVIAEVIAGFMAVASGWYATTILLPDLKDD